MEENDIEIKCTIELLAKPKDIASEALKKIVNNIEEDGKKLDVSDVVYGEPKLVEQDFYSAFATFKIRAPTSAIFGFILDYAPSSIEILSMRDTRVSMADLQAILNDVSGRLNQMDSNIKLFSAQNVILSKENEELKKKVKK